MAPLVLLQVGRVEDDISPPDEALLYPAVRLAVDDGALLRRIRRARKAVFANRVALDEVGANPAGKPRCKVGLACSRRAHKDDKARLKVLYGRSSASITASANSAVPTAVGSSGVGFIS